MNELYKHIEVLLLENDCVIVPGLGGFIAHYRSAVQKGDGRFQPPMRNTQAISRSLPSAPRIPARKLEYSTGSTIRKEMKILSRLPDSHSRAMTIKDATGTVFTAAR